MYYIYVTSGPSLLLESTDSMIIILSAGVNVQPSVPNIPTVGGGGSTGGGGKDTGGGGSDGGNGTEQWCNASDSDGQVMVCLELASGNLQRNVTVNVMTVSSPYSTGGIQSTAKLVSIKKKRFVVACFCNHH